MYSTYVFVNESFAVWSLDLLFVMIIIMAISVIISNNPVISVLYLIGLFLGVSCYLFIIGLDFIALSYILVYVGAISILFLFILMLINIRTSELKNTNSKSNIPLALAVSLIFNYPLYKVISLSNTDYNLFGLLNTNYTNKYSVNNEEILFISWNNWDNNLNSFTQISSIGSIMYTSYCIWLIITSVILLLAMVGAIVITIKEDESCK